MAETIWRILKYRSTRPRPRAALRFTDDFELSLYFQQGHFSSEQKRSSTISFFSR